MICHPEPRYTFFLSSRAKRCRERAMLSSNLFDLSSRTEAQPSVRDLTIDLLHDTFQ